MDLTKVDEVVERNGADPSMLIAVLQEVQVEYNFLPKDALRRVACLLNIPPSRVYSVANFYRAFSLVPRGRHLIQICLGTACHVRGSDRILEQIERTLSVRAGGTTADQEFSLETVNCLGACALGPVVVLDGEYHGRMTVSKVESVLKPVRAAAAAANPAGGSAATGAPGQEADK
jgi:NADH-quinone oxidoreductase subunit E